MEQVFPNTIYFEAFLVHEKNVTKRKSPFTRLQILRTNKMP